MTFMCEKQAGHRPINSGGACRKWGNIMKLAVGKETIAAEKRVAASPETVRKLIALGFDVAVESGAGLNAAVTDDMFAQAGATIVSAADVYKDADVILRVRHPATAEIANMK